MDIYDLKLIKNVTLSRLRHKFYKLNFMATSKCNGRCVTCNIWKNTLSVTEKDLKLEEIKKLFRKLPNSVCWLSLTGGEPFLRDDLVDIISTAVKELPKLCLIGIPSNGLLTEKTISQFKKFRKFTSTKIIVSFSIDGPPKLHDKIRGVPGGFSRTWKTYQECKRFAEKSKNLKAVLEMTLSRYNISKVYPLLKKLLMNGNKITLTTAHKGFLYEGRGKGVGNNILLSNKDVEEISRISDLFSKYSSLFSPSDLIELKYIKKIKSFIENPRKVIVPCKATSSSLAVMSNGLVSPCFMWSYALGNLRDFNYDIQKIYYSTKSKKCKKLIIDEKCPVCWTPCEAYQSIISSMMNLRIFI